jgi:hypothetical protein
MSSFIGLFHLNVAEKKFRYFSQSDGIQSNQFNFNAALILQSGEFLFGGLKGFNIFIRTVYIVHAIKPPV